MIPKSRHKCPDSDATTTFVNLSTTFGVHSALRGISPSYIAGKHRFLDPFAGSIRSVPDSRILLLPEMDAGSKENSVARSRLADFRLHKDEYFRDGANSPLDFDDVERFEALDYFPENAALAFVLDLDTDAPDTGDIVQLDTSDGLVVEFAKAGRVTFTVGDQQRSLTVLKDLHRGRFFLPFTDATTGVETYEVGRYLDPQQNRDGQLIVDFNYAYNPYCAYGEGWSCPTPPAENHLNVRIEAGEKNFALRQSTQ